MEEKSKELFIQEIEKLRQRIKVFEEADSGHKAIYRDLRERVKELNCLYGLSKLAVQPELSLEDLFRRTVDLIPPAWQYPEITCGRIIYRRQVFSSDNFKQTCWKQSASIEVYGEKVGMVEVYYTEKRTKFDEGPFLKEERSLIKAISKMLGEIAQRKQAEKSLQESELRLREQKQDLEHKNIALKEILYQLEIEKKKIKDNVNANVEKLMIPSLKKLGLRGVPQRYIDILQHNMEQLTSSFGRNISEIRARLTPREIEICNMIKSGLSSKEISQLLNISIQTVDKHRSKIRRKLSLTNTNYNLTTFLQTL